MPSDTHSIAGFRAAALRRFADGELLAAGPAGHTTGAVYLWGYTVEMALKAAILQVKGFPEQELVPFPELRDIATSARAEYGVPWPKKINLHAVALLGETLVAMRERLPGQSYTDPSFASDVRRYSEQMGEVWTETLRYHDGVLGTDHLNAGYDLAVWFVSAMDKL